MDEFMQSHRIILRHRLLSDFPHCAVCKVSVTAAQFREFMNQNAVERRSSRMPLPHANESVAVKPAAGLGR